MFLIMPVYAVEWINVTAPNGHSAELDVDSIKEYGHYYFYNIKVLNKHTDKMVVITMQSRKIGGLCARIKYYDLSEYENLNGDYENITKNHTNKLAIMEYASVAGACFRKVKSVLSQKQVQVQF